MKTKLSRPVIASLFLLVIAASALAAMQRGWGRRGGGYRSMDDRAGVPVWEHDENFAHDSFTFARVIYNSNSWGDRWRTDFPDSDLNFSLRLQQLTSMKVNPLPVQLELTDPRLFDYPFLYMIEVGGLMLSEAEAEAMRRYCLNGGFIMIDDFWGQAALDHLLHVLSQVFPDRTAQEVPLEHPIFQCVYPLQEKPQVPSVHWYRSGRTYEDHGPGSEQVHYMAIYDDGGKIMMFICHNTDLGDGWEREGDDPHYFQEFAVKKSYPLGINIVTYAMTH